MVFLGRFGTSAYKLDGLFFDHSASNLLHILLGSLHVLLAHAYPALAYPDGPDARLAAKVAEVY